MIQPFEATALRTTPLSKRELLRAAHERYTEKPLDPIAMFFLYGLLSAKQVEEKIEHFAKLQGLKGSNPTVIV